MSEQDADGCLLDSDASSHMCPFENEFVEVRPLDRVVDISIANGETLRADGGWDNLSRIKEPEAHTYRKRALRSGFGS